MNYFKKFTDFCGGFLAFTAIMYLIKEFSAFAKGEEMKTLEKLKLFFDPREVNDYRGFLILILLLAVSVVAGRVFHRLPYISFAVSLFPFFQAINLYSTDKISNDEYPMLYLIFASLHTLGSIIHAVYLDGLDGKRRGFMCANVCGGAIALFGTWLWFFAKKTAAYADPFAMDIGKLEMRISAAAKEGFQRLILDIALMVAVSVLVSILLRDVYFIDAILALFPFAYTVRVVLIKDALPLFGELMLGLSLLYLVSRVLLVAFEPMRPLKKASEKRE